MHTYPHTPHLEYEDSYLHLSKMALDVKLTKLMLRLTAHIENGDIHITPEERKKWNNMVSHEEYDEFVKALKKRLGGLEIDGEDPAGDDPDEWDENLFVTVRRLAIYLLKKGYLTKSLIIDLIKEMFGQDDLSEFLTKLVADATYVKIADLDAYIKKYIEDHKDGIDGLNGKNGTDGKDGLTPFIGSNGNWWIGTTDTGVKAAGSTKEGDGLTTLDVVNIIKNRLSLYHSTSLIQLTLDNAPIGRAVDDNVGGNGGDGLDEDLVKSLIDSAFDGLLGTIHTYYKKTSDANSPSLPTVNGSTVYPNDSSFSSTGWLDAVGSNPTGSEHLWMILTVELNGKYGAWTGPIDITGGEGGAGSDTTSIEYVFHLSDLEDPDQFSGDNDPRNWSGDDNFQTTKFRKGDWTDHPSGVTLDNRFEFMSYRLKTDDVWQSFSKAVIWSSYGVTGKDGDGVQYIFHKGAVESTDSNNWPPSWINLSESVVDKDGHKYQGGVGTEYLGPSGQSTWTDDPEQLTSGQSNYVSVRKYNGSTKQWGAYSTPTLWSYIPQDIVSVGALLFSPSMMLVSVKDGSSIETSLHVNVTLYKDSGTVTLTNLKSGGAIYDANGTSILEEGSADASTLYYCDIDSDYGGFTITIPTGRLDESGKNYTLKFTASANGLDDREGYFTISTTDASTGPQGDRGPYYALNLNTRVVRKSATTSDNPQYIPSTITCTPSYFDGKNTTSTLPSGAVVQYSIDSGENWSTYPSDGLTSANVASAGIVLFRIVIGTVTVTSDSVVFINDGNSGVSATEYSLIPLSDSLQYDADTNTTSGSFQVLATYKAADNTSYTAWNGHVYYGLVDNGGAHHVTESDNGLLTLDSTGNSNLKTVSYTGRILFAEITMQDLSNTTVIRSIVLPVALIGKTGTSTSTQTQTIKSYLRLRTDGDGLGEYLDGRTAATNTGDSGNYPQDYVVWSDTNATDTSDWGTYVCNSRGDYTWSDIPSSPNWQKATYEDVAAFDLMFANKAKIGSLAVNQVVVTDDGSAKGTVVAGMTSKGVIPVEGGDDITAYTSNGSGDNAVRIWAGLPTSSGNILTAPFRVTQSGKLTATDAIINGIVTNADGTSGLTNRVLPGEDDDATKEGIPVVLQAGFKVEDPNVFVWAGCDKNNSSGGTHTDVSEGKFIVTMDGTVWAKNIYVHNIFHDFVDVSANTSHTCTPSSESPLYQLGPGATLILPTAANYPGLEITVVAPVYSGVTAGFINITASSTYPIYCTFLCELNNDNYTIIHPYKALTPTTSVSVIPNHKYTAISTGALWLLFA